MDQHEAEGELFGASLDAFVETRARLAAALTAAGHKAEAQALKKVRRPAPSAWATNQVVRRARAEVDAFLEASDRLRDSQAALVAGGGDRGVYQADTEDLRRATTTLAEAARRLLGELGRPDDRAVVERVLANARAAALTGEARAALLGGALIADLDGGDAFGGLLAAGGADAPAAARAPSPRSAPRPRSAPNAGPASSAREAEAHRREQEASARQNDRASELADARRDEAAAREQGAATEAAATRARDALAEARRRADAAHEAARDAERAVRDAEATLREAQRQAAEAETRAGRATRRREALEK
jgi:hypothetical protein